MSGAPEHDRLDRESDATPERLDPPPTASSPQDVDPAPWRRLSARMIWVDIAQSLISLSPSVLAFVVLGVNPTGVARWAIVGVAVAGVLGAVSDVLRWVVTRYRVTGTEVQLRTGIVVRKRRSAKRDRIRSVDSDARLRHRVAGLRVVTIGAGQQGLTGESAFALDAVVRADAEELRRVLLRERTSSRLPAARPEVPATDTADMAAGGDTTPGNDETAEGETPGDAGVETDVLARLRPGWVLYNMFNIWAFAAAAGVFFSSYWLVAAFGVDLLELVTSLADWEAMGRPRTIALALLAVGALGVLLNGLQFISTYWRFELARVPREEGTALRTRNGLLRTREVNRDEARMRGMSISEPLLWRWMGMADTTVVTTGLSLWSSGQPSAILPRGPIGVALPVARQVLGADPSPFDLQPRPHPRAALRRRLWWATVAPLLGATLLAWPILSGAAPAWLLWLPAGLWAFSLAGAAVAYRALGHGVGGDYVVTRSGLMARATTVLRRDAVSTVAVRQSLFQRRLGLATVSLMTSAGYSVYEAPDVAADEAVSFAAQAAPGLLDPFLSARRSPRAAAAE